MRILKYSKKLQSNKEVDRCSSIFRISTLDAPLAPRYAPLTLDNHKPPSAEHFRVVKILEIYKPIASKYDSHEEKHVALHHFMFLISLKDSQLS